MTTIRIEHVRAAKLCSGGARQFFDRYGLSWGDFLRDGISEEELLALGDPLALKVIEIAKKQEQAGA